MRENEVATGDTLAGMEQMTVRKVAELPAKRRPNPAPAELIERRRHLPKVDPDQLRHDVDGALDSPE